MEERIPGTMQACLTYEKRCQVMANNFLRERYPDKHIHRPDYNAGGHQRELQKADVDVVISNKTGWPNEWYISEKFRSKPWDDFLIELYSEYPTKKPGWAQISIAHEHYFYFDDKRPRVDHSYLKIVPTWAIKQAAQQFGRFLEPVLEDMYRASIYQRTTKVMGYDINILMIKTYGENKNVLYSNVCLAIPAKYFEDIKANIQTIKTEQYAIDRS